MTGTLVTVCVAVMVAAAAGRILAAAVARIHRQPDPVPGTGQPATGAPRPPVVAVITVAPDSDPVRATDTVRRTLTALDGPRDRVVVIDGDTDGRFLDRADGLWTLTPVGGRTLEGLVVRSWWYSATEPRLEIVHVTGYHAGRARAAAARTAGAAEVVMFVAQGTRLEPGTVRTVLTELTRTPRVAVAVMAARRAGPLATARQSRELVTRGWLSRLGRPSGRYDLVAAVAGTLAAAGMWDRFGTDPAGDPEVSSFAGTTVVVGRFGAVGPPVPGPVLTAPLRPPPPDDRWASGWRTLTVRIPAWAAIWGLAGVAVTDPGALGLWVWLWVASRAAAQVAEQAADRHHPYRTAAGVPLAVLAAPADDLRVVVEHLWVLRWRWRAHRTRGSGDPGATDAPQDPGDPAVPLG